MSTTNSFDLFSGTKLVFSETKVVQRASLNHAARHVTAAQQNGVVESPVETCFMIRRTKFAVPIDQVS